MRYERQRVRPVPEAAPGRIAATAVAVGPAVTTMRVVSVNVGQARTVTWSGRAVRTGIYKEPVAGRVRATSLGIVGDRQVDLRYHGGPAKAVYAYPSEHYAAWRRELARDDLPWGMFGENLTTEGILEDDTRVGDQVAVGSVVLEVTHPRFPCYKLGIKFGSQRFVRAFLDSGRSGFYLAVVREGELGAGDPIRVLKQSTTGTTITAIVDEARKSEA